MTKLGGCINEVQVDLLQSINSSALNQRLAHHKDTVLGAHTAALDHDEVIVDQTVVGEATHGVDGLLSQIVVSATSVLHKLSILGMLGLANSVDLLVDISPVVVTLLTSTSDGGLDPAGMPGTNTGNLTQTLVGLAGQLLAVPTGSDTLATVTLGGTDHVNHFILGKHIGDRDLLLKVLEGPVNLLWYSATIDLNLHDIGLLLPLSQHFLLSVDNNSDGGAVALHASNVTPDGQLAKAILPPLGGMDEGTLLGSVPVLVEAPAALLSKMLSKDSPQAARAMWGLNVAGNTNNDNRGALQDSDGFQHFLLVGLGSLLVGDTGDVGHPCLVAWEGSQMDGLLRIILGEGLYLRPMLGNPSLWCECHGPMAGSVELPMRHFI